MQVIMYSQLNRSQSLNSLRLRRQYAQASGDVSVKGIALATVILCVCLISAPIIGAQGAQQYERTSQSEIAATQSGL